MRAEASETDRGGLAALLTEIQERTGLGSLTNRLAALEPAVRRAMAVASVRDLDQLRAVLDRDEAAFDALIDALTIGETYFFRDPRQFAFLRQHAIPDIVRHRPAGHVVGVWSAGCASGEEAYSLAILLYELGLGDRRRILGTDLSRRRLAAARRGRYGKWSLRGAAPEMVGRYFRRTGQTFELVPEIRASVRFEYLNLADDVRPAVGANGLDLIVCRNVLIYLDAETIARAARALVDRLAAGGWLLLAPSDPPLPDTLACEVVITDAGLAYRRGRVTKRFPPVPASRLPAPVPVTIDGESTPPSTSPPSRDAGSLERASVSHAPPMARRIETPSPEALAEMKADATRALAGREYQRAAAQAHRYLGRGGTEEGAWLALVRALSNSGRTSEAALSCAAALEAYPLSSELMVVQSLILTELGQHAAALEAARRALFVDRSLAVAHLACGNAMIRNGDRRSARRAFAIAARLLAPVRPDEIVPASGGETAGRLAALARGQLRLLGEGAR